MKYLKTYENIFDIFRSKKDKPPIKFETIYPNYSDKQYWSLTSYFHQSDISFEVILKFNYEEDLQPSLLSGGEYHFDTIVATKYGDWNVGDKYRELVFTRGNIFGFEENDSLKLATPEQIKFYDKYAEINKFNL